MNANKIKKEFVFPSKIYPTKKAANGNERRYPPVGPNNFANPNVNPAKTGNPNTPTAKYKI